MSWSSIRSFLEIPSDITGKGVKIAIIDSKFPSHPDIISNLQRTTYLIKTHSQTPVPIKLTTSKGKWNTGLHGLWTASAAGGSGLL